MLEYVWLVPLLPLIGFLINFLFGRGLKLSERVVWIIGCGTVFISLIIVVGAFYQYATVYAPAHGNLPYVASYFTWLPGGLAHITLGRLNGGLSNFNIQWGYQIDQLSLLMMVIVTFVGFWIHVFSIGYMHGDAGYYRFFAYLNLFMFSMLTLVMGSNFLIMFIGWEGVGLCSYLLIGYYFDKQEAGDAAKKAFVVNRIGDFGFALAIMGVFATFGTLEFSQIAAKIAAPGAYPVEALGSFGLMSWIALGLFVGATGKSAQIPLFIWLPDAMAGPTPVSALIHAATMVTAGVFMLTRTNYIFQRSLTMMLVVAIVGCATAFVAATIAITQTDIKKVLAYSTVSQLGYMFMGAGVGAFVGAIFHVFTHAFFKALLFLGAGSVIHGMHHEQEMPRMGGLSKYLPTTYKCMLAAWLAICGIVPFAGFFSKDEILGKSFTTQLFGGGKILWFAGFVTAGMTAFYMTRLMALTFWGEERFKKAHAADEGGDAHSTEGGKVHTPHESPRSMTLPLIVLACCSVVAGFVGIPRALQFGSRTNINVLEKWLDPVIASVNETPAQALPRENLEASRPPEAAGETGAGTDYLLMVLSLGIALGGIYFARRAYLERPGLAAAWTKRIEPLYKLSVNKWYWDYLLDVKGIELAKGIDNALWDVDAAIVDGAVNGAGWMTRAWSWFSGMFDKYVVDGAVKVTGWVVYGASWLFRSFQTGFWENYVMVFTIGLFLLLGLYVFHAVPTVWRSLTGK
ncbi:MAG TPA: NADH-quinone oxidoreductase subunit L [Blastocatellia bacterium]|nr:NADH-quinone oxidoreductase subunit L [Blastocatellia bacterium]